MAKLASALAHLKTKQLRFVVQKAQILLAAPTRGCKKLRLKRRGGQKVSAQKRKSARFELPWSRHVDTLQTRVALRRSQFCDSSTDLYETIKLQPCTSATAPPLPLTE